LAEDMKRDAEKQVQLEKKIEVNIKFCWHNFHIKMCEDWLVTKF